MTCGRLITGKKRPNPKFCSNPCYHKGQKLKLTSHKRRVSIIRNCLYCNRKFEIRRNLSETSKGLYCSLTCANKAQGLGRTHRTSSGDRVAICKAKETSKCIICAFDRYIEIADIIPRSKGGLMTWDNTLFMCPNHHRLFDYHLFTLEETKHLPDKARALYENGLTHPQKNEHFQRHKRVNPSKDKATGRFSREPHNIPLF